MAKLLNTEINGNLSVTGSITIKDMKIDRKLN